MRNAMNSQEQLTEAMHCWQLGKENSVKYKVDQQEMVTCHHTLPIPLLSPPPWEKGLVQGRQHGWLFSVQNLKSGGHGFKFRSEHWLELFSVDPKFNSLAMLVDTCVKCLHGIPWSFKEFNGIFSMEFHGVLGHGFPWNSMEYFPGN